MPDIAMMNQRFFLPTEEAEGLPFLNSIGLTTHKAITAPGVFDGIGMGALSTHLTPVKPALAQTKLLSTNPDQPGTLTPTGVLQLNALPYDEILPYDVDTGTADIDVYDFSADVGQSLSIIIRMDYLPSFDYRILDSEGNVLASGSQSGSNFEIAKIDFAAPSAGQFFFEMTRADTTSSSGDYQISLVFDEHSDDVNTTGIVDFDLGTVTGNTSFDGDRDWFRFTVEDDTMVFFDRTSNTDINFRLFDEMGNEIAPVFEFDGPNEFKLLLQSGGTYFIEALGAAGDFYEFSAVAVVGDVAGDPTSTADLPLDGTVVQSGFTDTNDSDWFGFSAIAGEIITLEVDPAGQNTIGFDLADANGEFFPSGLRILASTSDYIVAEVLQTGDYFAAVYVQGFNVFAYELSGRLVSDDFGDTAQDAETFVIEQDTLEGAVDFQTDVDLFQFEAAAGELIFFTNDLIESFDSFLTITVIDEFGNELGRSNTRESNGEFLTFAVFEAQTDGVYYLRVQGNSSDDIGAYRIESEILIDAESDTFAGAQTAPIDGRIVSGRLEPTHEVNFEFVNDVDVFAFSLADRGVFDIRMFLDGSGVNTVQDLQNVSFQVFNSQGNVVYSPASQGGLRALDLAAGDYYLQIGPANSFGVAEPVNYRFLISEIEDDFAGDASTSGQLGFATNALGVIEYADDVDWFALDASAGDTIYLHLSAEERSIENLQFEVFNPDGSSSGMLFSYSLFASQFLLEAAQSGTYYVAVSSSGDNIGAYQLSATELDGTDPSGQSIATAIAVNIGERFAGEITFGSDASNEDRDYFSFNVEAGQSLQFQPLSLGLQSVVYEVLDASGAVVAAFTDATTVLSFNTSGTYYVSITSAFFNDLGAYSFEITDLNAVYADETRGPDRIEGTAQNDFITGLEGSDVLSGLAGNDVLDGGIGNDELSGGDGDDTLFGGDGNDLGFGGAGADRFFAGAGNDTAFGGDGNDQLRGEAGADTLNGEAGIDTIFGGIGNDAIDGGLGNDRLYGERGNDMILAGDGDDVALGQEGEDLINGGAGRDLIWGGEDNDIINGDEGDDILRGNDGDDTLNGGLGADNMQGGSGINTLNGGDGNDKLIGVGSHDVLNGGEGDDFLLSGDGTSEIFGGAGRDFMIGGAGADTMDGGIGNDSLFGNEGDDVMIGGEGFNRLFGGDDNDDLTGGSFIDWLFGGTGNDILRGGGNADELYGEGGDDQIFGEDGNDLIRGNDGIDVIDGGSGNDNINGNQGADTLTGGAGADLLFGGSEVDTFVFAAGDALSGAFDRILDLEAGELIDLGSHSFVGEGAFTGGGSFEVRYSSDGTTTRLQLDRDGDGAAEELIVISGDFDFTSDGALLTAATASPAFDDGLGV